MRGITTIKVHAGVQALAAFLALAPGLRAEERWTDDGVVVGAPPNLLFVPDRDGDDRADTEDIEVRLTGWGIRDRHEVVNSLHWGPDGWLYGLQGFATPSKVRKPVGKGRLYEQGEPFPEDILQGEGVDIVGGVWRYHPTKDRFEVVAHGFSNPSGIDYDAKGQLVMSAYVIPHLWHVVPGGIYQRQGGRHFKPYVYSDIQTIADHRHRSAHGGARVYLSDATSRRRSRDGCSWPTSTSTRCCRTFSSGRDRASPRVTARTSSWRTTPSGSGSASSHRARRRALRARLARRRHLRRQRLATKGAPRIDPPLRVAARKRLCCVAPLGKGRPLPNAAPCIHRFLAATQARKSC